MALPESSPQQEEPKKRPHNIQWAYNGNFYGDVHLNIPALEQFSRLTQLRTQISISDGRVNMRGHATPIGDTLAFVNAGDINSMARKDQVSDNVIVTTNFARGTGDIFIDDNGLTQQMMDKTNNRIDKNVYLSLLDRSVKKGLDQILTGEKAIQLEASLVADAIIAIIGVPTFLLGKFGVENLLSTLHDSNDLIKATLELGAGFKWFKDAVNTLLINPPTRSKTLPPAPHDKYYDYGRESIEQFFPPIHLSRRYAGKLYLANHRIILPQQETQ